MRILPNLPRLRIVAAGCLAIGSWLILQPGKLLVASHSQLLAAILVIAAALFFALGLTFWMLGTDYQAGVVLDRKGITLNLGHSASFIAWDNIAAVGVSSDRTSLFALGSRNQLGIRLHHSETYLQSYEGRIPAARSTLGWLLRQLRRWLGEADPAITAALESTRRRTGYDLVIPESQLGRRASTLV